MSFPEREAVEAGCGVDCRCCGFAPETRQATTVFQNQIGHSIQGLAEKGSADAAGDLVIARGSGLLAGDLPHRASGECIAERVPVVQPCRSGKAVVHRALIGMTELVGLERVPIGAPATAQVAPDAGTRHAVVVTLSAEVAIRSIEQDLEPQNLRGREAVVRLGALLGGVVAQYAWRQC